MRQWQHEDMENYHIRQIRSLTGAGLNPALAYGGFGGNSASAPVQSLSHPPDYALNRLNSAREGMLAMAQVAKLKADTAASESVADLNRATAIRTGVQTQIDTANAGLASISLDKEKYLRDTYDSFDVAGKELTARKGLAILEQLKSSRQTDALWSVDRLAKELGFPSAAAGMESIKFRHAFQELVLQQFSMPKASAEHDFYSTAFGKSIAPYLNSAESISRSIKPFSR